MDLVSSILLYEEIISSWTFSTDLLSSSNRDSDLGPPFYNIDVLAYFFKLVPETERQTIQLRHLKYNNYNPIVIIFGLISSLLIIISIGVYSHLQIKRRMESHEPDSVI